jgi:hypothetical protein
MKRRDRHGLRGCRDDQSKGNSNQPDHSLLLCEPSELEACVVQAQQSLTQFKIMVNRMRKKREGANIVTLKKGVA